MAILENGSRSPSGAPPPHALSHEAVLAAHDVDPHVGLTGAQVEQRQTRHAANVLASTPAMPRWRRFAGQFADLVIWVLIGAAFVSGLLREWVDAIVILAIVVLNGLLGFLQEEKAGRALAALQKLSAPRAKVLRDGRALSIPASELVPGDRVDLEAGDYVPADVRLISSAGTRAQEAALTGESTPADKDHRHVLDPQAPLGDRVNMAFMGTAVTAGTASAVVVATGMDTELGRIAGMLRGQVPEPTPLQRRLNELGRTLIWAVLGIVAIIFTLHLVRGGGLLEVFLLSVSLAVAAVPEGMPAVVTIALAMGVQRMARRNALVRRLPSVETLGAVTVICSDKTGTLTRNEMTVREAYAGSQWFDVGGGGYAPIGTFQVRPFSSAAIASSDADLSQMLRVGAWCNHARLAQQEDGTWTVVGDPTEGALLVAGRKAGIVVNDSNRQITHEIPFDSDRKVMSIIVKQSTGEHEMFTKGAPEVILAMCSRERLGGQAQPLDEARRKAILEAAGAMAGRALRVLAMAYRQDVVPQEQNEQDLVFAGLVGMIDPPRDEARSAVQRCRSAGIRPVMITGDHPETAIAIAVDLGIARKADRPVSGAEVDRMDDDELAARVEQTRVYARVSAEHKLRIVDAWRSRGQVLAMTGDGVNDAPAVKAADIGIAMGITGTDVTKEASDMVLTDDNFASIVNAVEEGRTIFDNIRKFVHYLLATNAGEVLLMFVTALLWWPAPLLAIQILWINLVTDALPALALGIEPPEPDVMSRPPRPPGEPLITLRLGLRMLYHGVLIATAAAVGFFAIYANEPTNLARARTVAFCVITYAQVLFAFSCRSERYTMPELGLFSNRWLIGAAGVSILLQTAAVLLPFSRSIFMTEGGITWEWFLIVVLSFTPVTIVEVAKFVRAKCIDL